MSAFTPRSHQSAILEYTRGTMGISAVPGSGKTYVLSALAAQLIAKGNLQRDQEVLVVTLVNAAVDNFAGRIGGFMQASGLLPQLGYRVRTLHGLAHDIVREKPAAVGLETRFTIIDERESDLIRKEAANSWLSANHDAVDNWLDPTIEGDKRDWVRRQQVPEMLNGLALAFIRSAKDRRVTPDTLRLRLESPPYSTKDSPTQLPLAEMGLAIYTDYQRALTYRGAVDFDDLIRLALDLLESDPDYLERLRYRFPYILEDEAQDSSLSQEQILRSLAGPDGNWVRVGDPNQAIFETFTTADPKYLRAFIVEEAEFQRELPVSGRSQASVIALANHLIDWVMQEHPAEVVRDALAPPYILPTEKDDPQPNPPENLAAIQLSGRKFTPEEEVLYVIDALAEWLPDNQEQTVAVLVPRNTRGVEVIEALKRKGLPYVEFLSSTSNTRAAAGSLAILLAYLSDPGSAARLSKAYLVWRRDWRNEGTARTGREASNLSPESEQLALSRQALLAKTSTLLRKLHKVEQYISPLSLDAALLPKDSDPGGNSRVVVQDGWLSSLAESEPQEALQELRDFRQLARRWLGAVALPIDQLVLTLAQDVFTNPADLALAHKLALVLRQAAHEHSAWRLPELTAELAVIARNERRFIGFSADDSGFDPERHRGKVVVTTMHKAKGLEWDRVHLLSVNNYDFPSLQSFDQYISEKWFVRDGLNLEAEALSQLSAALAMGEYEWYREGQASLSARADYVRERLRLLYVGITRAKRELVITWNTGRRGDVGPSLALQALLGWLDGLESK
jgi:DNA helicase II / ATP-dependent DNA helicase PcrA